MRVRIRHLTRYCYEKPALFGPHLVRLRPAEHARAALLSYNLTIDPKPEIRWQYDPWGNKIARVTFPAEAPPSTSFTFTVDAAFEIRPVNPFDFFVDEQCKQLPIQYPEEIKAELAPFLQSSKPGPLLAKWLEEIPAKGYITDHIVALNRRVANEIRYIIRNEPGIQTSEETLEKRSGSCRDSAALLCDAFRAQGFAARFVSGYLIQLTDEGNLPDEAKGIDHDVVDLHAWCEVFIPGAGWVGLDGTSGLFCNEGHIPLACVVNPSLGAPIDGTSSEIATHFEFEMEVARLGHEPRPRVPYTEEQWNALKNCGDRVDARLAEDGLVLTMGGEPTWTSRIHPREKEWNTEALGPTKWQQALRFTKELRKRFGVGPVVMHRMGKQYPGESLPRWNLDLLWRDDAQPLWTHDRLLALEVSAQKTPSQEQVKAFGTRLCELLSIDTNLVPAFEDPWAHIVREMNLAPDIDPNSASLEDPEERRTLARSLSRGLGSVVGFALPLFREGNRWITSPWKLKREHLFLLFGDSPMGLRLPLDRIGGAVWPSYSQDTSVLPPTFQHEGTPVAPFEARVAKSADALLQQGNTVRTALCLEVREGVLHLFLPPLPRSEDWIELVQAIEKIAVELDVPVRLEGYPPANDPRIRHLLVTPDPGVIEVNVPWSKDFHAYVEMLERVGDAALHSGLCTEKYQIDGREVGAGGGNHITLGGPSTLQSPFLQDPGLLASVLRYLQNHPSLSYVFTGLFIGPTSQAPRIDEARHDALDELELALSLAERARDKGEPPAPWLVDRLFRNLLVDLAGNTHRTEVCIDKLYDPAGPAGRHGLLEFRAFEMPPHERMAAAQVLLLRSLVALFVRQPYRRPLVRWGAELHDRFMLPHYLTQDLWRVLDDLREGGIPIDRAFYQPFLDYRFPLLGAFTRDDITLELRPALEPWLVLGEEPAGATVSRYVDSSLERLQIRVDGLTEGRHQVLVNGIVLPLRPTGRASERIAGVRFRAWQPPHCLQPTIPIHHPLRFDLIDTWAQRSLGACFYHVWHPDGRAYDEPPLTAYEAGARRAQRFTTDGHAPYPVRPVHAEPLASQPYTLDLRRYS